MNIRNTETEKNLIKAVTGEALANNRYSFYAKVARKEGYIQIANIFEETALNEREHCKRFYSYLDYMPVEITNTYIAGIGSTKENLKMAFELEGEENTITYPKFGDVAQSEGFIEIAELFYRITTVEKHHEVRYKNLWENLNNKKIFNKDRETMWKCLKCGYIVKDIEAPEKCLLCHHPKGYFEILCDNF